MSNKIRYCLISLSLFSLTYCAEQPADEEVVAREVEISAAVAPARAAVISGDFSSDFACGIYANKNGAWLAGASWINNDASTVRGAAGHAVAFGSGPYFYPTDGSPLTFYAFAPQATQTTAAGAGTSPIVTHYISGQEDVMWASAVGSIGSAPVLRFTHKLTQLQFTFKSGTNFPASGASVVSLQLRIQPSRIAMTVETGACTFAGSVAMQALSSQKQLDGIPITAAGTDANSPVMTRAATGASAYLITVVVKLANGSNVTYTNIPVSVNALAGSAHMITLTFSNTTISCSASLRNWTVVNEGNVSI